MICVNLVAPAGGSTREHVRSWRYEFYASYDLPARIDKLRPLVDAFAHRYNHHGPHEALGDLTPADYLKRLSLRTSRSHMC